MADPIFGSGNYRYQVVDNFFKRPRKWPFVEATDVAVDKDDNVYVLNRGPYAAVMIFDKRGNFLDAWGKTGGLGTQGGPDFADPHGITVGPDGDIYTADTNLHIVRRWTKEGKLLLTIGRANRNAVEQGGQPFNRPTHLAVASNGDFYASDGYGNSHIHVFDPEGRHKLSWGGLGDGPGQFDTIHSVFVDHSDGDKVYAADRYNSRVQVFTSQGEFLAEWTGLILANSVRKGPDGNFVVAELHHSISVVSGEGEILARWGDDVSELEMDDTQSGLGYLGDPLIPTRDPNIRGKVLKEPGPGRFVAPHGIAVDSEGSIYVAEVCESWSRIDRGGRACQKFVRL